MDPSETTAAFDRHERERWAGRADAYVRSFARLCAHPAARVLDAADVHDGTALVDVGTGPGTLAALAVARGARVTALDADPAMIASARRAVPAVDGYVGALPDLPLRTSTFGAAAANFVLNHVGDPSAATRELARVVAPGGRIAVTIWPYPQPPLQRLWGEAYAASGLAAPADLPRLDPARDFPRTADGLGALLTGAGLTRVEVQTVTWTHRVDPDEWWAGPAAGITTFGLLLERLRGDEVARVRAAYDRVAAPYLSGGMLALPTAALLGSGVRPG
ncbi:class I SAM-dependent methyltransferase [Krasilnikovia sp. MM14-A1259]|uniref:class I SAM-dependent methyltransferase n=1 Tax=Krasilnikovia sp. MM14-A1259 TaxID=3373539 RepID=UPI003821E177